MKDIKLSYYGRVKEGKIALPRKRLHTEVVGTFEGHSIEVIFQRKRNRRSSPQNRYYWSVVIPFVLRAFIDLGHRELQEGNKHHHEMIHEVLKDRFLDNGIELSDADGQVIDGPSSTTRCTTTEFMDYLAQIQQWAAESLNTVIPDPNEQLEVF